MRFDLRMAWRSLGRTRGVTVVLVIALSLGIGTWYAQRRIFEFLAGKEPRAARGVVHVALERGEVVVTGKRPQIVVPLLPSLLLTLRDAEAVVAEAPGRSAITFGAPALLEEGGTAERVRVRYATPELFAMFEVPLAAGRVWGREDEAVVDEELARRRWGSVVDALGRAIVVAGAEARVVGVVAARHGERYHLYERFVSEPVAVYLPLARGLGVEADFAHVVARGETGFASTWVELPSAAAVVAFVARVSAYVTREQARGRDMPPFAVTLRSADAMRRMFVTGGSINLWPLLAAMALVACVVNLVRMLMVKFAGRGHDLGLLRALGARRRDVMAQLLLEAVLIGLLAGALGIVVGVAMMPLAMTTIEGTAAGIAGAPRVIDACAVLVTLGGAILASVGAALYPAWLLSRGVPAAQLGRS